MTETPPAAEQAEEKHPCPVTVPGIGPCGVMIERRHLMDAPHWRLVPKRMRDNYWLTRRAARGDPADPAYRTAVRDIVSFVNRKLARDAGKQAEPARYDAGQILEAMREAISYGRPVWITRGGQDLVFLAPASLLQQPSGGRHQPAGRPRPGPPRAR
jgi:hypothetical protein